MITVQGVKLDDHVINSDSDKELSYGWTQICDG